MVAAAIAPAARVPGIPFSSLSVVDAATAVQLGLLTGAAIATAPATEVSGLEVLDQIDANNSTNAENFPYNNADPEVDLGDYDTAANEFIDNQSTQQELIDAGWVRIPENYSGQIPVEDFSASFHYNRATTIYDPGRVPNAYVEIIPRWEYMFTVTFPPNDQAFVQFLMSIWGIPQSAVPPPKMIKYNETIAPPKPQTVPEEIPVVVPRPQEFPIPVELPEESPGENDEPEVIPKEEPAVKPAPEEIPEEEEEQEDPRILPDTNPREIPEKIPEKTPEEIPDNEPDPRTTPLPTPQEVPDPTPDPEPDREPKPEITPDPAPTKDPEKTPDPLEKPNPAPAPARLPGTEPRDPNEPEPTEIAPSKPDPTKAPPQEDPPEDPEYPDKEDVPIRVPEIVPTETTETEEGEQTGIERVPQQPIEIAPQTGGGKEPPNNVPPQGTAQDFPEVPNENSRGYPNYNPPNFEEGECKLNAQQFDELLCANDCIDEIKTKSCTLLSGLISGTNCEGDPYFFLYQGEGFRGVESQVRALTNLVQLIYERVCQLETTIAPPDHWQTRVGPRAQLVVLWTDRGTNGGSPSYWSFAIPHYNRGPGFKPQFPNYIKGDYRVALVLEDNSKLIVYGNSKAEAFKIINYAKTLIDPAYLPGKIYTGETRNSNLRVVRVYPMRGDFYSQGRSNAIPDWSIPLS